MLLRKVPNNVCNIFWLSLGLSKPMVQMVPPALLLGTRTCPGAVCLGRDLQLETSSITSFYTFMSRCNRAELENSNALAPGWASGHARGVPMCPGGVQHNHGFFSERAASRYVLNKKGRAEFRLAPGIPEFRAARW